jgi:hypothetical protein
MPSSTLARGNILAGFLIGPTLTPASVNQNTTAEQTFTVKGLLPTDIVSVTLNAAQTAGIGIANARVSAADTLAITFSNSTGGPLTPASGQYTIAVDRPENPANLPTTAL